MIRRLEGVMAFTLCPGSRELYRLSSFGAQRPRSSRPPERDRAEGPGSALAGLFRLPPDAVEHAGEHEGVERKDGVPVHESEEPPGKEPGGLGQS
jgi:hypothetical protein